MHAVKEGSISAYAEGHWNPVAPLRLSAGLRADYFNFDVHERIDLPDQYSGNSA